MTNFPTEKGFHLACIRHFLCLVLGVNVNGDKKLKVLLVYRIEKQRALKNVAKTSLPVNRKSYRRPGSRGRSAMRGLLNVPCQIKKYCAEENLDFSKYSFNLGQFRRLSALLREFI
jgi:hypothetical protein